MSPRIVYIISHLTDSHEMRAVAERLPQKGYDLHFLLLNNSGSPFEQFLQQQSIPAQRIGYAGKKDSLRALWQLYRSLRQLQPDIVHTHLVEGSLLGLLAAWLTGIPKRIHTRHHSTFHHEYHPSAVRYDRLINRLSTHIVAISENVRDVLVQQEGVDPSRLSLIHHGIEVERFQNVPEQAVRDLREKYRIPQEGPVIGMIGKYVRLKGHEYVIRAFQKLLGEYPGAHLVIANAQGPEQASIRSVLQSLPGDRYTEIRFETDIFALYQLFDIFIHVPVNRQIEAFGQVYIEALAAGIPSVFTLSGIAPEVIRHRSNALVVDYQDSSQIYRATRALLQDKTLRQHIVRQGQLEVEPFQMAHKIDSLKALYDR